MRLEPATFLFNSAGATEGQSQGKCICNYRQRFKRSLIIIGSDPGQATLDPCMVAVIIQQLNYGKFF